MIHNKCNNTNDNNTTNNNIWVVKNIRHTM